MLVFMCRDPGDATSKVSCYVEPSWRSKNGNFDAIISVPLALPLKFNVPENENFSFVIIMHLPKGLTHIHSQIKNWLHFGESFTLNNCCH